MRRDLYPGLTASLVLLLTACVGGGAPPQQGGLAATPGSDLVGSGAVLPSTEHVSAVGGYQTSFEIPVPPAPAAPRVSLAYDSQSNTTLAGSGWDLYVGWPMTIMRDVRFGTPQWARASAWLWGATPLVPANTPTCGVDPTSGMLVGDCSFRFRLAPEALALVTIELKSGLESAHVNLADGTVLLYEPVVYDGKSYPGAPAGAETPVLGFRLAAAVDRNGYRTCFQYRAPVVPAATPASDLPDPDGHWGEPAILEDIYFGAPPAGGDCASQALHPVHRVHFQYEAMSPTFSHAWSMKFGAPVSFDSLLTGVSVYANGATTAQDSFALAYVGGDSETRRPLLASISGTTPLQSGSTSTDTRVFRTFDYGQRMLQFDTGQVVELGALGKFPQSLAGAVSRPMRRANSSQGLFGQVGRDQVTDAAPWTHATTEEWQFSDINGDGLPDIQWGDESGSSTKWSTFEGSTDPTAAQPPQQQVLINEGVVGSRLVTTALELNSHANSTNSMSLESLYVSAANTGAPGFTPWFWGEGRGDTRTAMPVAVSAPEIAKVVKGCSNLQVGQDTRIWPEYPDGTFGGSQGSVGDPLAAANPFPPGGNRYLGNPLVTVALSLLSAYQPSYSVSSALSGWLDLDGDGVPEFVATPAWIERFSINGSCVNLTDILNLQTTDSYGARIPEAAFSSGVIDTAWHVGAFNAGSMNLSLARMPGPPGVVGLPLSYDISTGAPEGFGFTVPIGSLVSTGVQSLMCMCWYSLAAAAPGLLMESFSPRANTGFSYSVPAPSGSALLENLGTTGFSNGSSAYGSVSSFLRINYDFTVQSATTRNRSESRAQLVDINGDGLPDYLLYNSGAHSAPLDSLGNADPLFGVPGLKQGSLVVFMNSPQGFGTATVINEGFDYPGLHDATGAAQTVPGILATIESKLKTATDADSGLVWKPQFGAPPDDPSESADMVAMAVELALLGSPPIAPDSPDQFCESYTPSPVVVAVIRACSFYSNRLGTLAQTAADSVAAAKPFFDATTDALPSERAHLQEIITLYGAIKAEADALSNPVTVIPAAQPPFIDTTTAEADALVQALGVLAQTLHQLGHSSRINALSRGFTVIDGATWEEYSGGLMAETRGFVDLNGDGLPDYVVTNDRQSPCAAGQWEVFWGIGTSEIASRRAFRVVPSCVAVPTLPTQESSGETANGIADLGLTTLPLSLDHVSRPPQVAQNRVDSIIDSYVVLSDINGDGRPDILIAVDADHPWKRVSNTTVEVSTDTADQARIKRLRPWHVFMNNGSGFESQSLDIVSPSTMRTDLTAVTASPAPGMDGDLDAQYPIIRTTLSVDNATNTLKEMVARDRTDANVALIDIDGDGTLKAVRRVRINDPDPAQPQKEGLLVWRRANVGGPQDLMIEDRDPRAGSRTRIDYQTAGNFQWTDAMPTGAPPQFGHQPIAGVARHLVRSVTTERLMGRPAQETVEAYDYKLPHFDLQTRNSTGFAMLTRHMAATQPNLPGVALSQRNAQRPNMVPGITQDRVVAQGTDAPVSETLRSFAESDPTTAAAGIGGLLSVFSAPARLLTVTYPSLTAAAIFDVGFDGREPWRDRVAGRVPILPAATCSAFTNLLAQAPITTEQGTEPGDAGRVAVATGGAAHFSVGDLPVSCSPDFFLQYLSPHPSAADMTAIPLSAATLEVWLKPDGAAGEEVVVEQTGAYRLSLLDASDGYRWQLQLGTANCAAPSANCLTSEVLPEGNKRRWHHLVATFSVNGGGIFEDGRILQLQVMVNGTVLPPNAAVQFPAVIPAGNLVVGCSAAAPSDCLVGDLGELRIYPEMWLTAPRVVDTKTTYQLPDGCTFEGTATGCPPDFGQPLVVRRFNDLAIAADDVASQFEYAKPDPLAPSASYSPLQGTVAMEAARVLQADGTLGDFLTYSEYGYDQKAVGSVSRGNRTESDAFDGFAQTARPTQLRVKSTVGFENANCPGRPTSSIDPSGARTSAEWDLTCSFISSTTDALGHTTHRTYYGLDYTPSAVAAARTGPYGSFVLQGRFGELAQVVDPNVTDPDAAATLSAYDNWGRLSASWSQLDRADRPRLQITYEDATCEKADPVLGAVSFVAADCTEQADPTLRLRSPSRVTTLNWDDQLRRCTDLNGTLVSCADSGALAFAAESATGAYRTTYAFSDGQIQTQGVVRERPSWTISGTADYDPLGRLSVAYKARTLPGTCPGAGTWCDAEHLEGIPPRNDVAAVQIAYDAQGRVIRTYGQGWPRCNDWPSAVVIDGNGSPTAALSCDLPNITPTVNDVLRLVYPSPGDRIATDGNGVPTLEHRDARGLLTLFQEFVRPTSAVPPGNVPLPYAAVTSTYDALGRLIERSDQNNNVTLSTYDALSRLRSNTDPDLGQTTYEYDLRSQAADRIVASGEKTHNEYDALGRLIQTDYLLPHTVATGSTGVPAQIGKWGSVHLPSNCERVAGPLEEPTRFGGIPVWPDPPPELEAVSLSEAQLGAGRAQFTLPFDVDIRASAQQSRMYHIAHGTAVVVTAAGQVMLGVPPGGAQATLTVLTADLKLDKGGLRVGVAGSRGTRRLVIEWRGTLATSPTAPLLVRATLMEESSSIRYDYIHVPENFAPGAALRLSDGHDVYDRSLEPGASGAAAVVGPGTAVAFGGPAPQVQFAIRCDGLPAAGLQLPYTASTGEDPTVKLDYRVFADCDSNTAGRCSGEWLVGYRDKRAGRAVHDLTSLHYTARALSRSRDIDHEIPESARILLPQDLRGRDITLLLTPKPTLNAARIAGPYVIHIVAPGGTTTEYLPEERVHRSYDSSEPPYYFDSRTNGTFETLPLLDVTFDIPGVPVDRSPSQAIFRATNCGFALPSASAVMGASGKGLEVPVRQLCQGAFRASGVPRLARFTVEMWVAPEACPGSQPCHSQRIFQAGSAVALTLRADGHLGCEVAAALAQSDEPLPTDAWSHVALLFAAGRVQCAVNGVIQAQSGRTPLATVALGPSILLGDRTSQVAVGIDELRLIGAARSAEELHQDALRPLRAGPPRGNLVHIDFDHPTPGGQLDQSKAQNNATLSSGRIVPGVEGMSFDTSHSVNSAADGQIEIPDMRTAAATAGAPGSTLELGDALTSELWVKRRAPRGAGNPADENRLIGKWQGPGTPGWRLDVESASGRLRWEIVARQVTGGATSLQHHVFVSYEALPSGQWHHVAATYDGARMRVFMDGLPLHRWCGSGPLGDKPATIGAPCSEPPPQTACTVETQSWTPPADTPGGGHNVVMLGDAECVSGTIDNTQPILAANDNVGPALDGQIDELRVSNYAKREFEVAASSRLAATFTQTLGRETLLRNRFIYAPDGTLLDPEENNLPHNLVYQPARETRAFDVDGHLVSDLKHVLGQGSATDYFLSRVTPDSMGRGGLMEYPHGEVLVSQSGLDGTLTSLTGYGPGIVPAPAAHTVECDQPSTVIGRPQSQVYLCSAASTVTGLPAKSVFGNQVLNTWRYDDAARGSSGAFGPESLYAAAVTDSTGAKLSDRGYQWDGVGNLTHLTDSASGGVGTAYDAAYTYDDLRRVQSATLAAPAGATRAFSYCYNELGNLVLIDGSTQANCYDASGHLTPLGADNLLAGEGAIQDYSAAYTPPNCPLGTNTLPHGLTHRLLLPAVGAPALTAESLCYDASGKLLWSASRGYDYFARGKVRAITGSATQEQFLFDGNGVRVAKTDSGGQTQIMLGASYREIQDTAALPSFEAVYVAASANIARRVLQHAAPDALLQSADLAWFSSDHLGGTYFMTNAAGHEVANTRAFYRPFGAFLDATQAPQTSSSGNRQFTSKELDATGLYDYGARPYDPQTGRFTQADRAAPGVSAQSQNSFSYGLNNPLVYGDSGGTTAIKVVNLAVFPPSITILIPVKFVGVGTTSEIQDAVVSDLASLTLDPRDAMPRGILPSVQFVVVPTSKPINGVLNTVDISPFSAFQHAKVFNARGYTVRLGGTDAYIDSARLTVPSDIAAAAGHEILHIAGLTDRYQVRDYNFSTWTRSIAVVPEFPAKNKMSLNGTELRLVQWEEAINSPGPTFIEQPTGPAKNVRTKWLLEWERPNFELPPLKIDVPAKSYEMELDPDQLTIKYIPPPVSPGDTYEHDLP